MNFVVAEKQGAHGILLVVTDKELIGKHFEEGNVQLDLRSVYYKGEEMSAEDVKTLIREVRDVVFTGKAAVALGIEMDLIDPKNILYVQNVPHAQVALE